MSRRRLGSLSSLAVGFTAVAVLGCSDAPGDGSGGPAADPSGWPVRFEVPAAAEPVYDRVVLFTIDTLRADHVSAYGYRRETTPFFDRLAERGVLFENAVAAISHTAPSHATMLTGLPAAVHGVVQNGTRLDPEAADLGRLYGEAGFETAAFLNVKFLTGITSSFDLAEVGVRAGETTRMALEWLRGRRSSDRFFLWVHLYDPHRWKVLGLTPENELETLRAAERGVLTDDELYAYLADLHGLPEFAPGEPFDLGWTVEVKGKGRIETRSKRDYLDLMDAYDAQTLFSDRLLERLYAAIEELDLPGSTLWIVTSDHGEGLASHGVAGHGGRIYQEQLRVPLLLHATDGSLGPRRVTNLVQHVDLFPTLAELLGARVEGMDPLLHGASLAPLLHGRSGWRDRPAFAQRRPPEGVVEGEDALQAEAEGLFSLQSDRYKYLLHELGPDEFYDLQEDPLELENRIDVESVERDALERLLEARIELFGARRTARPIEEIPEEWRQELRDLGYAQ